MDEIEKLKARIAELEALVKEKNAELAAYVNCEFEYMTDDGGVTITQYKGTSKIITIPEFIDGIPVTALGSNVFRSSASFIEKVIFPPTLKKLGAYVFCNCTKLSNISLDNIKELANYAFWYCRSLSEVTVPGTIKTIPLYCFAACAQLHNVTICEGVETILQESFSDTAIEQVTLPESLKEIRADAFKNCSQLSQITFLGYDTVITGNNISSQFPRNVVIRAYEGSPTAQQLRDAHINVKPIIKSHSKDGGI